MPVGMTNTDPLLLRQTVLDTTDARGLAEFYGHCSDWSTGRGRAARGR